MALEDAAKDIMLDAFADVALYASLHTALPGSVGSYEVTGGSPAYARKSLSWAPADGSYLWINSQIVFDVPGSITIHYLGYWSALTSGTFYGFRNLSEPKTYGGQGFYTITAGDIEESLISEF
jgi:hypothetical protein